MLAGQAVLLVALHSLRHFKCDERHPEVVALSSWKLLVFVQVSILQAKVAA